MLLRARNKLNIWLAISQQMQSSTKHYQSQNHLTHSQALSQFQKHHTHAQAPR